MPKWVYRLESISPDNGLWYSSTGDFVFGVAQAPNCSSKDLPMDFDERYKQDGKDWFSSCSKVEDLTHWYSVDNARWLVNNGFVFTKYLAQDYVEYELETVFLKETTLARVELSVDEVFGT